MTRAGQERPTVLIIAARFYDKITDALIEGAVAALSADGAAYEIIEVPGALEIPQALAFVCEAGLMRGNPYHGAVALGCVIRGETSHYDIVAAESARALMDIAVRYSVPVGNGILTVDTPEQARVRAAINGRDKGGAAAKACLTLVAILNKVRGSE